MASIKNGRPPVSSSRKFGPSIIQAVTLSTPAAIIALFAFTIFFLEATLFSTLLYTHRYLVALKSIAFALLGAGLGTIAGHWLVKIEHQKWIGWALAGTSLALIAVYLNIVLWPQSVAYSPIMILPFFFCSMAISKALTLDDAGRLYFYDLTGATVGVVSYVVLLPLWGEEGNFLFLLLLMTLAFVFRYQGRKWIAALLPIAVLGLLFVHLATSLFSFTYRVACYDDTFPQKIFCRMPADRQAGYLVASRSDLAARIDIAAYYSQQRGRFRNWVYYDGMMADKISGSGLEAYRDDLRVPEDLAANPDVLIIGTAGDSIIRPVRLMSPEGQIDGLEINAGLAQMMQGELRAINGDSYNYLDRLFISDARTFLSTRAETYDVITLLNTYTGRLEDSIGAPEYLHTTEAMESYLDHLNPDGFLIFEIRDINDWTRVAGFRILNAVAHAFESRDGNVDVTDNFYIYEYFPRSQRLVRSNNYTMVIFKNSSFTAGEIDYLDTWIAAHNEPNTAPRVNRLHVPGENIDTEYSRFVAATTIERANFAPYEEWQTTPTRDDQPFLADVLPALPEVSQTLRQVILVILAGTVILLVVQLKASNNAPFSAVLPFWLLFAASGLAYLLIEVALIQWLQIFTGLPAYTFVFVLGALLLSSGLGSRLTSRWTPNRLVMILILLILTLAIYAFTLQPILQVLQSSELWINSFIVAILLLPIGVLMGMPFPLGIQLLRKRLSPAAIPLSFGINTLYGTLGSMLAVWIAVSYGFRAVFITGLGVYLFALLVTLLIVSKSHSWQHNFRIEL